MGHLEGHLCAEVTTECYCRTVFLEPGSLEVGKSRGGDILMETGEREEVWDVEWSEHGLGGE